MILHTKRSASAWAVCCFLFGTCAPQIAWRESSRSLLSRNTAIFTLKTHNLGASTRNVNAYLAGVASKLIEVGS